MEDHDGVTSNAAVSICWNMIFIVGECDEFKTLLSNYALTGS